MTNSQIDLTTGARRAVRRGAHGSGRSGPRGFGRGLLALLWLGFLLPTGADALQPALSIHDLKLRQSGNAVLLSLELAGISDETLRATVESGFPWLVSYDVELYLKRRLVPDARVRSWTLRHVVRYDNLRDEFQVTRETIDGEQSPLERRPPVVVKEIDSARTLAARVNGFPITDAGGTGPATYVVRVRARMKPLDEGDVSLIGRILKQVPLLPWRGRTAWSRTEFER